MKFSSAILVMVVGVGVLFAGAVGLVELIRGSF